VLSERRWLVRVDRVAIAIGGANVLYSPFPLTMLEGARALEVAHVLAIVGAPGSVWIANAALPLCIVLAD
jgi:hypothetical protein